ncbi:MAG: response regulator, partial [Spirochaetota bacterium]
QSAQELTRIIDDVLDFSRIEANKLKIEVAPFDLIDLVESARSIFAQQAAEKGIDFRIELRDQAQRWYHGDQYRVRQVLHNLLSNAVKFTEHGEIVLTVRSQPISEHLHELTFEVRDTGIGIKDSLRESIFESFQQGDISYSKSYQGTGLGLSISRRLAKLMSGQLYFTSSEGEGSVFFFTLPLHLDHDEGPTAAPESAAGSESVATSEGPREGERAERVLIAEDNAINVLVIRTVLERAGYLVETAATGREVLDLLAARRFGLVLMDISMPDVDGIEATRRIRDGEVGPANRHVPIIAITAHSMRGDREEFLAAGMDEYLSKPFSKQRMLDLVNHLVRERAANG